MNEDVILDLFKFYAKFVPKPVLKKMFAKTSKQLPGYNEVKAEVLSTSDDHVIPDIDAYIFSPNEEFLSKKMKNQKGTGNHCPAFSTNKILKPLKGSESYRLRNVADILQVIQKIGCRIRSYHSSRHHVLPVGKPFHIFLVGKVGVKFAAFS